MEHPPELALVGEPEVATVIKFQHQMLKANRGRRSFH